MLNVTAQENSVSWGSSPTGPGSTTAPPPDPEATVMLSGRAFMTGCVAVALALLLAGRTMALPTWLLAAEVLVTILGLFLFGSFKYPDPQERADLRHAARDRRDVLRPGDVALARRDRGAWLRGPGCASTCSRSHGLDELIHADTMLFILGLTYFVSVIAQTRLLEGHHPLPAPAKPRRDSADGDRRHRRRGGRVGHSRRRVDDRPHDSHARHHHAAGRGPRVGSVRYAVMVCTAVTTICGVWLAYGEPPNLIMKANLHPYLDNAFFLLRCAPAAIASYS